MAEKAAIQHARTGTQENIPILGMFREDIDTLAEDLSAFLRDVVDNGGVEITQNVTTYTLRIDADHGSSADICVLCSSPQEVKANGDPRLPYLLRHYLRTSATPIDVFNPRDII